jgi:hypothetical protein
MKIIFVLILVFPLRLFAEVTGSCESVLSGTVTRSDLSDVCYTQYGDTFLQWQGYWDGNANKQFTLVTGWQQSLTAMTSEAGWRLPTLKELHLLTTKQLIDVSNTAPDAFAKNWMLQQWFLRDAAGAPLIPLANSYLLSSSYQGDSGSGTSKVFALNIATGLTEALASSDFDSKSVFIVKVKQAAPTWVNITTKYSNRLNECLQHSDTLSTDIVVSTCDGSIQQKWFVETNSGFIRSYSGGCLQAKTFSNGDETTYETCSNYLTTASPVDSERWDAIEVNSSKVFKNRSNTNYYFYAKSNGKVPVWNYSALANDTQNIWYY